MDPKANSGIEKRLKDSNPNLGDYLPTPLFPIQRPRKEVKNG